MAQGSVAPEGKHGGVGSISKLEEKILGISMGIGIALSGSVLTYLGVNNFTEKLANNASYQEITSSALGIGFGGAIIAAGIGFAACALKEQYKK